MHSFIVIKVSMQMELWIWIYVIRLFLQGFIKTQASVETVELLWQCVDLLKDSRC